jgi:phosphoketolase
MRRQSTPGHRLNSGSFGTMGVGLRFAVGAKAAKPDTQVICLHGDGSFGQNDLTGTTPQQFCRFLSPARCQSGLILGQKWTHCQQPLRV